VICDRLPKRRESSMPGHLCRNDYEFTVILRTTQTTMNIVAYVTVTKYKTSLHNCDRSKGIVS